MVFNSAFKGLMILRSFPFSLLITLSTFFGSTFPPNWYTNVISRTGSSAAWSATLHCRYLNTDGQAQLVNSDGELLEEFFPSGHKNEFATRGSRTDPDAAFSGDGFYVWTAERFQAGPWPMVTWRGKVRVWLVILEVGFWTVCDAMSLQITALVAVDSALSWQARNSLIASSAFNCLKFFSSFRNINCFCP